MPERIRQSERNIGARDGRLLPGGVRVRRCLGRRTYDHILASVHLIDRGHPFERRIDFRLPQHLAGFDSSARTLRSRVPVKISPPAVTTGPTFG